MEHKFEIALASLAQAFLVVGQRHARRLPVAGRANANTTVSSAPSQPDCSEDVRRGAPTEPAETSEPAEPAEPAETSETSETSETLKPLECNDTASIPSGDLDEKVLEESRDRENELRNLVELQQAQISELQDSAIGQKRIAMDQQAMLKKLTALLTNLSAERPPQAPTNVDESPLQSGALPLPPVASDEPCSPVLASEVDAGPSQSGALPLPPIASDEPCSLVLASEVDERLPQSDALPPVIEVERPPQIAARSAAGLDVPRTPASALENDAVPPQRADTSASKVDVRSPAPAIEVPQSDALPLPPVESDVPLPQVQGEAVESATASPKTEIREPSAYAAQSAAGAIARVATVATILSASAVPSAANSSRDPTVTDIHS